MSFIKKTASSFLHRLLPDIWYLLLYRRTAKKIGYQFEIKDKAWQDLLNKGENKKCLQIGVRKQKYGKHWTSVDLFDKSDYIDFNYDIHDLKFENEKFDVVVCKAVLEHVVNPQKAISELTRVLKKDGVIWIEVPFNQHFHPSPKDFWRVTLQGMRIWMKDFAEISAGYFSPVKSAIHNAVYFYGKK
jgi:SAM-dependent methyltransferase